MSGILEAIRYSDGHLEILDQLLLPSKTQYMPITTVEGGWSAIKSMQVRGAPAIAIVGVLSLAVDINRQQFSSKQELHAFVKEKLQYLITARPTAVNMKTAASAFVLLSTELLSDQDTTIETMKNRITEAAVNMLSEDVATNKAIGEHGANHILEHCARPIQILTHCNTGSLATAGYGTALGVIRSLWSKGALKNVSCTETRPYNQGARLTAYELLHDQIPSTLVCDTMVASLMQSGKVSAVVVGADRVVANGDTANKIGTYQIAVCAKYHGIPFYVASPTTTIDMQLETGACIPIEERPSVEMICINGVQIAPKGMNCWNPAFDVTPASLITGGIVTEKGVCPPSELKNFLAS